MTDRTLEDAQSLLSGKRKAGWVQRPCFICTRPTRFPAGLVKGTKFEGVKAICDYCERDPAAGKRQ